MGQALTDDKETGDKDKIPLFLELLQGMSPPYCLSGQVVAPVKRLAVSPQVFP